MNGHLLCNRCIVLVSLISVLFLCFGQSLTTQKGNVLLKRRDSIYRLSRAIHCPSVGTRFIASALLMPPATLMGLYNIFAKRGQELNIIVRLGHVLQQRLGSLECTFAALLICQCREHATHNNDGTHRAIVE